MKIAVLRKCRAVSVLIWAAAHTRRYEKRRCYKLKKLSSLLIIFISVVGISSCVATKSQVKLERSQTQYSKPQTSTEVIKGKKVEYELWFDKNKWKIVDRNDALFKAVEEAVGEDSRRISFILRDNSYEVFAIITESRVPIPLKEGVKGFNKVVDKKRGQLFIQEIRTVNNNEVLFTGFSSFVENVKFFFLYQFLTNKTGTISIGAWTSENLFAEHKPMIIDLLNGLVDFNSKIHPAKSKNEVVSKLPT